MSTIFPIFKSRWLVAGCGLLLQGMFMIFFISAQMSPTTSTDVQFAPVERRTDICRITYVVPFTNAWINGIQPGMLVQAKKPPFPDHHNEFGMLQNCQPTSSSLFVRVIDRDLFLFLDTSSPGPLPHTIITCIMTIILSLTGVMIFLKATDRPIAWVSYCLFLLSATLLLLSDVQNQLWVNITFYSLGMMLWGITATFVCLLRRSPQQQRSQYYHPYIPLLSGVIVTLCNGTMLLFFPETRLASIIISGVYVILCVIVIGWVMFWGFRQLKRSEKHISRLIVAGAVFFLLLQTIRHDMLVSKSLVANSFIHLLPAPLLLLPVICSYLLMRHEFPGLSSLFSRRVMRVHLWCLLAFLFIVPTTALFSFLQGSDLSQMQRDYSLVGVLLIGFWLFPHAWLAIRNFGDQLLYQDFYEYNRSLRELSTELTRLQHFDQVSAFILPRLTKLLHARGTALLVRTEQWMDMSDTSLDPWRIRFDTFDPFLPPERLAAIANLALTHVQPHSDEPLLLDGVLIFVLSNGERLNGFLCLGSKRNTEQYSRQDKSFLATLAAQLSVVEANSRYLELARYNAEQLAALNQRVISTQEDERRHLALELHDDVLQQALLLVRQLADAKNIHDITSVTPHARSIVQSLRQICLELRPPLLDELGLEDALRWLARQTEQRARSLQVTVSWTGQNNLRLPPDVELALYRITQEALTNVVKHARANRVIVRFKLRPTGIVSLLICDDGRGFFKEKIGHNHLGMVGMHERISAVKGTFHLLVWPGRGVAVRSTYQLPSFQPQHIILHAFCKQV